MAVPGGAQGGASFECSLTGQVLAGQFRPLYDRLLGLCEHAAHSKMFEHELKFAPAVQRPMYSARNDEVHLRLRVKLTVLDTSSNKQPNSSVGHESSGKKRLRTSTANGDINSNAAISTTAGDVDMTPSTQENKDTLASASALASVQATGMGGDNNNPAGLTHYHHDPKTVVSRQYQLCQYGHPEPGRNLVVRSAILVKIHGDAFGFMTLLGYGFEEEYVRRGYNFMYNNICRISVFREYKLSKQHDAFSAIVPEEETAGGVAAEAASPWQVEITSSFVSQENVNSMSEEINLVRNLLAGSVAFQQ
ncbi:hypothetical protein BGZ89_001680 [Linnemannia elongata]|uniref:Mediator of RNA polymerase II transcription subunit 18 n=1 Tax=Linnemannia elongata AG-77 TaxID=1314771 RepID=A0A197JJF2_9FUNG|nr:hypothetical protein BGZ89_001680 [Linnemannia elongata]OAQ25103.1 hypothetical protein K457DRAFT_116938 [Linnemannia elongata AG-77]